MTDRESAIDSFCAWDGDTLVLNILGKPGSNRDAIGRVKGKQLKVSVTETTRGTGTNARRLVD